jgi:hypothetical protein
LDKFISDVVGEQILKNSNVDILGKTINPLAVGGVKLSSWFYMEEAKYCVIVDSDLGRC